MDGEREPAILAELGAEFRALVASELGGGRAAGGGAPERRQRRGRIARRTTLVVVLLCLIAGVAVAARLGGGGSPAQTRPARIAGGAGSGWRLLGYRHGGRLCLALAAAGELTSGCGLAPGERGAKSISLVAGGARYVAGAAGPAVAAVRVEIGSRARSVATRAAAGGGAAARAGVPRGLRWFVARSGAGRAPARVVALGPGGRALGPGALDCSLGVVGRGCEALIEAEARERARMSP
jgi:hypothetical protein